MKTQLINNSNHFSGTIRSSHNNEGGEPLWNMPSEVKPTEVTLVNFMLINGKLTFIQRDQSINNDVELYNI